MSDSIPDRARQLLALAQNAPMAQVQATKAAVEEWHTQCAALLGDSVAGQAAQAICQEALINLDTVMQLIMTMREAAEGYGNGIIGG